MTADVSQWTFVNGKNEEELYLRKFFPGKKIVPFK
ncbi:hypothetical protein PMI16_00157 [Herbaspirillum sp. CF444]|nr:hypothetical protein PMI16_00157 [Herbaspirillum sp. CF444]